MKQRAEWLYGVDMDIVREWAGEGDDEGNCDAYADAGEEYLKDMLSDMWCSQEGYYQQWDMNALAEYITHFMERDLPDFLETFCQWNSTLSDKELKEEYYQANRDTIMGLLESVFADNSNYDKARATY
jgi:hypothetical protein